MAHGQAATAIFFDRSAGICGAVVVCLVALAGCIGGNEPPPLTIPSHARYAINASDGFQAGAELHLALDLNGSRLNVIGSLQRLQASPELVLALDAATGRWQQAEQGRATWWPTPWGAQAPPHLGNWYPTQAQGDMRPLVPLGLQWPLLARGNGAHEGESGSFAWSGSVGPKSWRIEARISCMANCMQEYETGAMTITMSGARSILPEEVHISNGQRWNLSLSLIDAVGSLARLAPQDSRLPDVPRGECPGPFPCPVPADYRRNFQAGFEALMASDEWQAYDAGHADGRLLSAGVGGPIFQYQTILGQEIRNETRFGWIFSYEASDGITGFTLTAAKGLQGWEEPGVTSVTQRPTDWPIHPEVPSSAASWQAIDAALATEGFVRPEGTWAATYTGARHSQDPYQQHLLTSLGDPIIVVSLETGTLLETLD